MNYSYVTLLTNDSYVNGVILLVDSLRASYAQYPLTVLYTEKVSPPTIEILKQLEVNMIKVPIIETPEYIVKHNVKINPRISGVWRDCWTKFHIFNLTQFDKIVFLDADILVLKNLDHLFEKPHMTSCLDGEYFNLWPEWPHFNTGCLVIKPSPELYQQILNFGKNLKTLPKYVLADQEILNLYFKDWPEKKELHLNKYYDIFPPYVSETDLPDLKQNCYFVHYVGRKPWDNYIKNSIEQYSEYYYDLGKGILNTITQNLNYKRIQSQIKLAIYAICKNEISNIKKWLDCFSIADYVCVLDTGSTDGTWEYLQEQSKIKSNLIINQKEIIPWRFDTARNESLKLIPKDTTMFFMVDLDELILNDLDWVNKIKNAWTPSFSRARYTYYRDITLEGSIQKTIQEYRIHSKEWYKYTNIVHESLVNTQESKYFSILETTPIDICVYHFGNSNPKNYLQLCEKEIKNHPDNTTMRLQLAIEYELKQDYENSAKQFEYLIRNGLTELQSFELARCFYGLGYAAQINKQLDIALGYYREGRIIDPYYPDNYIGSAEIYSFLNNDNAVIQILEEGQKQCLNIFWCSVCDINCWFTYLLLGTAYFNIQKEPLGFGYICIADILEPNNPDIERIKEEMTKKIKGRD